MESLSMAKALVSAVEKKVSAPLPRKRSREDEAQRHSKKARYEVTYPRNFDEVIFEDLFGRAEKQQLDAHAPVIIELLADINDALKDRRNQDLKRNLDRCNFLQGHWTNRLRDIGYGGYLESLYSHRKYNGEKISDLLWFVRDVGEGHRNLAKVSSAQVLRMVFDLERTFIPNIVNWASENLTRQNSSVSAVTKLATVCEFLPFQTGKLLYEKFSQKQLEALFM
jgi:hypothetical protein